MRTDRMAAAPVGLVRDEIGVAEAERLDLFQHRGAVGLCRGGTDDHAPERTALALLGQHAGGEPVAAQHVGGAVGVGLDREDADLDEGFGQRRGGRGRRCGFGCSDRSRCGLGGLDCGGGPFRDVVLGAIPYALIMVLFTILLIFVPEIVTWLPETMSGR